jgi:O-antigen ligase
VFLFFLAAVVLISPIYNYIELYLRFEEISTGRDKILIVAKEIISSNYLIGVGPGLVGTQIYNYMPFKFGSPDEWLMRRLLSMGITGQIHNFYVSIFCEIGIIGFLYAIAAPFIFIKSSVNLLKKFDRFSTNWVSVQMIIAIGICYFIRAFFEPYGIMSYGFLLHDLPLWLFISILLFYYYQVAPINKEGKI